MWQELVRSLARLSAADGSKDFSEDGEVLHVLEGSVKAKRNV